MVAVAIWSLTSAMAIVQESDAAAEFWYDASLIGSAMLPAAWLTLAIEYTGRTGWLRPRMLALLTIEPFVFLAIAWTETAGAHAVSNDFTFGIHNVYGYTLVAAGIWLFAKAFRRGHSIYSWQAASVLVAVLSPAGANLLLVLGVWPWSFDPTPVAASAGGVALVWGLFRAGLFDIIPVAREAVIEGMRDGVIVLDRYDRIVDVNAAASETAGLLAATLVGRHASEVYTALGIDPPGDDDPESPQQFTKVVANESRFFELRPQVLHDKGGLQTGRLFLVHDITANETAERALRDAMTRLDIMAGERTAQLATERERLTVTMRSMVDGVIVLDRDGKVALLNDAAAKLVGHWPIDAARLPISSLIPQLAADLVSSDPEVRAGVPPRDYDLSDLSGRVVQASASPIMDGPEAGGSVLLLRDVTRERASQSQMEQEGRLASLGQMAAGIAHDFNNFLTGVVTSAETLSKLPDTPARSLRILEQLGESGRRTAQLVRQVLEFSRESVSPHEVVDLGALVRGMQELARTIVPENVALTFSVEADTYPVDANGAQLQHVLTNLISNAVDAAETNGRVSVHLATVQVGSGESAPLPDMPEGAWAALSVSDDGMGIAPESVSHIFDPFFTTKGPGKGTGLGLAQVYGVVKQHGGHVHATSQLGVGTTVTTYFPISEDRITAPAPAPREELPRGQGETILLVEDDSLVVEALSVALEYLGYRLLTASNGMEGIASYRANAAAIDLVLTDVTMPGMDGIELFHLLRQENPDVRVVAMTGYAMDDEARAHLAAGIVQWLEKPPPLPELAKALRKAIESPVEQGREQDQA